MLISLVFESAKMNKIDLDATMIGVNVPFAARLDNSLPLLKCRADHYLL